MALHPAGDAGLPSRTVLVRIWPDPGGARSEPEYLQRFTVPLGADPVATIDAPFLQSLQAYETADPAVFGYLDPGAGPGRLRVEGLDEGELRRLRRRRRETRTVALRAGRRLPADPGVLLPPIVPAGLAVAALVAAALVSPLIRSDGRWSVALLPLAGAVVAIVIAIVATVRAHGAEAAGGRRGPSQIGDPPHWAYWLPVLGAVVFVLLTALLLVVELDPPRNRRGGGFALLLLLHGVAALSVLIPLSSWPDWLRARRARSAAA